MGYNVGTKYASDFPSWDELTRRDQLLSIISDTHKDVYGCRFRGETDHLSDDDLERMLDQLYVDCEEECEADRVREAASVESFEKLVAETIASGADDRKTAIEWLKQAEKAEAENANLRKKSIKHLERISECSLALYRAEGKKVTPYQCRLNDYIQQALKENALVDGAEKTFKGWS